MTANIGREPGLTLPILIERLAARFGDAAALCGEEDGLSYRELARRSNRYARWGARAGLKAGDVVCLLMANCAEYPAIWLGLTRIGVTVALVNTNLEGALLAHAVTTVEAKLVIVGSDLADTLAAARPRLPPALSCREHGSSTRFPGLDGAIGELPGDPLEDAEAPPPALGARALLLYTSGTTGLPKAANVSHLRLMQWSHWAAGMMDVRPEDRMYDCLPMYHSIGGVVAVGSMLVGGGSVVLRRRFSASRFWDDIVDTDCTLFHYVGELCRYLVNSPPRPAETRHRVRLCCGNGLAAGVWIELQRRFRIPRVLEFYAATEGNFSLYNCEGRPGSIGRIPPFLVHRMPVELVEFDAACGEPRRDAHGFCVRCAPDAVGEAIGRIAGGGADAGHGAPFEGYTDAAASRDKVLHNVFAAGDAWLRSGDLMRRDAGGYFYFVDRIGDTFRWKGENVSTTEVASVICAFPGVREAAVYGVRVPGNEGRAGMAAIVVTEDFALAPFRRYLASRLPAYARPVFVRLCRALATTATLKPIKEGLVRDGCDPATTADPLFFAGRQSAAFVRLDAALYRRLQRGELAL